MSPGIQNTLVFERNNIGDALAIAVMSYRVLVAGTLEMPKPSLNSRPQCLSVLRMTDGVNHSWEPGKQ